MDPAPPPPDGPTEPVPRRRDERRAIPVALDAHQAWATGVLRHVRKPLLGPVFAAVNALVFVVVTSLGADARTPSGESLVRFGASHGPRSLGDEPWRLLTAGFLHAGLLHLVINGVVLVQLRVVEQVLGRAGWLVVYFASILAGNLCSAAGPGDVPSVGASGGVLGLLGAVVATTTLPRARTGLPDELRDALRAGMLQTVGLNVLLAFTVPDIDHVAHLGGFVAGFTTGVALVRPPDDEFARGRARRAGVVALAAAAVLGAGYATVRLRGPALERARASLALPAAADDLADALDLVAGVLADLASAAPPRADAEARLDEAGRALDRAKAVHARYAAAIGLARGTAPDERLDRVVAYLDAVLPPTREAIARRRLAAPPAGTPGPGPAPK